VATYPHVHADGCLNALGDPTRRAILERVAQGPQAVGELASGMPVSRPAVSQHLRVLSDAGLVIGLPEGNRRVYRLDPRGVEALRAYLDRFWPRALAAFRSEVERPITTKENP
jgi:DNA-binding transcriptional ArsR family regulator